MSNSNKLHSEAMDLAELALIEKSRRNLDNANRLFAESLRLEMAAIEALDANNYVEPTYSILHRSAATLALDCNEPRLAEKLIANSLSHDPPPDISEELRDLLEQVNFRRHLALRGVCLEEDEIQMSLAGIGVGFGLVQSNEFLQRVDYTSKLLYRIVERRNRHPFREKGRVKQAVKDEYELFISVPRAASFAVTMKLGRPLAQQKLPGLSETTDIVDEFMDLMQLVNKGDRVTLEERIPDKAYLTNFVQLAKQVAPDGINVKIVGFTSLREGRESFVELTRPKRNFITSNPIQNFSIQAQERVTVKGTLRFADATHPAGGEIRIVEEDSNTQHLVKVPEGMMNDIVKPLWNSLVVITGVREGKIIRLEDIEAE